MGKKRILTNENSVLINAKKLNTDVINKALKKGSTATRALVYAGVSSGCISGSVRSYFIHFKGYKAEDLSRKNGWVAFTDEERSIGYIFVDDLEKIVKSLKLGDIKDYIISYPDEEEPKEKDKPVAKRPEVEKLHDDMMDIKELLRVNNILLEQLIKTFS